MRKGIRMSSFKDILKKSKLLVLIVKRFRIIFQCTLTILSPVLNSRYHYKRNFNKRLNSDNPRDFNEKLLWLKLNIYNNDALVKQCADKYAVRSYVNQCGYEEILIEIYGVYDNVDEIPWNELPDKFVLKWNFGCGFNIICADKSKLDIDDAKRKLKKWRKSKIYLRYSEMQYKTDTKKIICERYLESDNGKLPPDYKIYCFHGKVHCTLICTDRDIDGHSESDFYDRAWENKLPYTISSRFSERDFKKPDDYERMIEIAEKLSEPFPFVRVDFYNINGNIIFGEMTFTPSACVDKDYPDPVLTKLGDLIELPKK